jgi:hypothetical protein
MVWTDPADYQPLTASKTSPGGLASATVAAAPMVLTFSPATVTGKSLAQGREGRGARLRDRVAGRRAGEFTIGDDSLGAY